MGAGLPSSLVDLRAGPAGALGFLGPSGAAPEGRVCLFLLSTQAVSWSLVCAQCDRCCVVPTQDHIPSRASVML